MSEMFRTAAKAKKAALEAEQAWKNGETVRAEQRSVNEASMMAAVQQAMDRYQRADPAEKAQMWQELVRVRTETTALLGRVLDLGDEKDPRMTKELFTEQIVRGRRERAVNIAMDLLDLDDKKPVLPDTGLRHDLAAAVARWLLAELR